jgi:hypothetical protein
MSQSTARHETQAKPGDEDDDDPRAPHPGRQPGVRPRRPVGQPNDDGGVSPDEPGEDEFGLLGDNDLGAADLGPAAPDAHDPDADSGRIRKITR